MVGIYFDLYEHLIKQVEDAFVEGLKRKGFAFENRFELESFIKKHCTSFDNITLHEKTYLVKGKAFFLHKYNPEIDIKQVNEERKTTFSATYGSFTYL